jgi:ribosomal protein S21
MADERLEKIEQEIQHARKTAEEADILADPRERHFYETGAESDIDDQTIAP